MQTRRCRVNKYEARGRAGTTVCLSSCVASRKLHLPVIFFPRNHIRASSVARRSSPRSFRSRRGRSLTSQPAGNGCRRPVSVFLFSWRERRRLSTFASSSTAYHGPGSISLDTPQRLQGQKIAGPVLYSSRSAVDPIIPCSSSSHGLGHRHATPRGTGTARIGFPVVASSAPLIKQGFHRHSDPKAKFPRVGSDSQVVGCGEFKK
ncbi:hypothetical protein CTRI78_v009246 [Colletotrichum trifolii]|uniref:Uncharacterized protein n=1 Tax=Colletotrichum trifolii TaxID=5466 RepID=A0A4R8QVE7_COLTR|nr:hypothetical protein CTRI78_v009246 [Colletotrichum trifolii]